MKADLVIESNLVWTGIEDEPFDGGVAIAGNKIIAVGDRGAIEQYIGEDTVIKKYADKLVTPGLIDAHVHFFMSACLTSKYATMEFFGKKSEEECVAVAKKFYEDNPDLEQIVGMGFMPAEWDKKDVFPTKASLDAIIPDKPVYINSACAHIFWLNSKALEVCGITRDTESYFGLVQKDESGEPTGILFDIEAEGPAFARAFVLPESAAEKVYADFTKMISTFGITSVANMSECVEPIGDFPEFRMCRNLVDKDRFNVRLHLFPALGLKPELSKARALREAYQSDKLRVAGLKQFSDGVTSSHTAALTEPYSDDGTVRHPNYPQELLNETLANANKEGFGVRVHAIGDASIHSVLDACEYSLKVNGNHGCVNTIEHVENILPEDLDRFAKLGVIASYQPHHMVWQNNDKEKRIGLERAKLQWPYRTLLEKGTQLAFGSDFPCVPIDPMYELYAAVERKGHDGSKRGTNDWEKMTMPEALKAYTSGSAAAINFRDKVGTLEVGKLADIAVFDKNLFEAKGQDILDTKALLTVLDGKIVHEL